MNKRQLATYNMSKRLENFLNGIDVAILSTIPFVILWFTDIKTRLIALAIQIQAFDDIIKGYQKAKNIARAALVQEALNIVAQIKSYANSINDVVLFDSMSFTKTLLERCNSADLLAYTQNIADAAILHLPDLAAFGITQPTIDAFIVFRTTYIDTDPKPEEAKEQREAATVAVGVALKAIMQLWLKIDNAMTGAAVTKPILAQDYFRARKVEDPQTRTNAVQGLITTLLGVPMPFVTITCATLNLNRKATKNGRFIIKSGPHMQHVLIFNYPGYNEVKRIVTITTGLRKNIVIMMEEIDPI